MDNGYVLLTEKEELWAKALMQVLEDNNIPCSSLSVNGAGLTLRTGIRERLKIYVPVEFLKQASELTEVMFSECGADVPGSIG